jgi:hypothetical protein
MSSGWWQTGSVARTLNCRASMSDTVSSPRFETTTVDPSGETLASPGAAPTRTLPSTMRCSRSITLTLAEPELAT